MAAKRTTGTKSTAKRRSSSKRSGSARSGGRGTGTSSSTATAGLDKSIESFRDSLERSVTISRDRLQEVVDDAVRHGRMQRRDAEKMVSDLVSRGRRQTSSLIQDLERVAEQARKELRGRSGPARRQATKAARRAGRAARDVADRPLAEADRLRRRTGLPARFPITAYDQLTGAQVKSRLRDLSPAELRKVRDYEMRTRKRKGVVNDIDKKLA
jgi:polyhydroxyalkanoate synthesis regulator phasin